MARTLEWWRAWRSEPVDRFGIVLLLVLATIVVSALVDVRSSPVGALTVTVTSGAALVASTGAVGAGRRASRAVTAAALVVVGGAALFAVLRGTGRAPAWGGQGVALLWLALVLAVPPLVIRRIVGHRAVAMRTVLGAVTAYLQIAVAYAVLYQTLDWWTTTPVLGASQPSTAYTYLSLTTISTLGLGDLTPTTDLARLAVASEAVLGQLFLVTVVAVVVSRFSEARRPG